MDFGEIFSQHKTLAIGIGAVAAGMVAYSYIHKSSSSASTPTAYNPSSGNTVSPTQYLVPYTGFAGMPDNTNGNSSGGSGSVSTSTGTPSSSVPSNSSSPTPPVTTPSAPAPAAPSTPGYGIIDTAAGKMINLGSVTDTPGYEVGGGAPVYFGNAQNLAQGTKYLKPNQDVYTPVQYANFVSKTPYGDYLKQMPGILAGA